ncbi:uncharacterized protein Z518_07174 [Rhinocladiella mackenziei CBS 650.93]|uniref:Short chain dehydrogenase/reductase n=1 Tax=Rhinocladiella mackenziei CBS 650.93 TaxID=1442369 RepID=A0A0D2IK60_9EURO|nr:uncharacterized protein Z518_07174 [Rhinocladiella mackenziei CBS 650.93]KIX03621.1 hypothetical protein Z518_07174 [Rhinocladiella mackenziei CBS 650.93]
MASRSLEKGVAAQSSIESEFATTKGRLSTVQLDVTDENSIRQAANFVDQKFGHLDVLVNNAASGNCDPDVKTRFQVCMDTNVVGPAVVAATFRSLLLRAPNAPYSIYVSSGGGSLTRAADTTRAKLPVPSNGNAYCVSKAALNMVMLQDYVESMSQGAKMKVIAMCPGFVVSNLRGTSEELRSGWGQAGDPMVSGETILSIIRGERDGDLGKLVHKDGVYPW